MLPEKSKASSSSQETSGSQGAPQGVDIDRIGEKTADEKRSVAIWIEVLESVCEGIPPEEADACAEKLVEMGVDDTNAGDILCEEFLYAKVGMQSVEHIAALLKFIRDVMQDP